MIELLLFLILLAILYGGKDKAAKAPYTEPWDQSTATRDLICGSILLLIAAAPFAVLWWFVMSIAMAARH